VVITTPAGYTLRLPGDADESRKVLVERERIAAGNIRDAIVRRQRQVFEQAATQAIAARFARNTCNLALEVIGKVVTAYRSQPIRQVADATPEQRRELADLIDASRLPALMPTLARLAWWCGPVLMIPWPDGDAVRWQWYQPSKTAVVRRGDDVVAAAVTVGKVDGATEVHLADELGLMRLLVWPSGDTRVLAEVPAPRCLAVEVRTRPIDPGGDDAAFGAPLHDAAVDAGVVEADLAARRKSQSGKQMLTKGRLFGNTQDAVGPQPISQQIVAFDEGAIELGAEEDAVVLDLNTPPDTFIRHIEHLTTKCLAAYGLELAAPLNNAMTFELSGASLATERHTQALELAACERQAIAALIEGAEAWGYASNLPRGRILVFFQEQHAVSDPLRREELYKAKAARGGTNPVEAYMLDHPGATVDEAEAAVAENIRRTTEITGALADRRALSPANAPQVIYETEAQTTGREGGSARGGASA